MACERFPCSSSPEGHCFEQNITEKYAILHQLQVLHNFPLIITDLPFKYHVLYSQMYTQAKTNKQTNKNNNKKSVTVHT